MRNLSKIIMSILVFILIFGSFDYVMAHSMPYSLTLTNPNLESFKIAYNQSNPKAIYNNFNIDIDSEEYFFNLTIFPSALSGEVFLILTNETSGGLDKAWGEQHSDAVAKCELKSSYKFERFW